MPSPMRNPRLSEARPFTRRPSPCGLALAFSASLSACSFVAISKVPSNYQEGDDLHCTKGLAFPLIDMAGTILSGVLAINLLSTGDNQERDASLTGAGISSGILALGMASSAVYGSYQVNRCRQAGGGQGAAQGPGERRLDDRVPPGSEGGACKEDGSCDDLLMCDAPMQTCIPDPSFDNESDIDDGSGDDDSDIDDDNAAAESESENDSESESDETESDDPLRPAKAALSIPAKEAS